MSHTNKVHAEYMDTEEVEIQIQSMERLLSDIGIKFE